MNTAASARNVNEAPSRLSKRNTTTAGISKSSIHGALSVLFEPDDVVELRAFKDRKTASGYFDDHDALAREAKRLDKERYQVYVTLNEVNSDLLARAANRVNEYP